MFTSTLLLMSFALAGKKYSLPIDTSLLLIPGLKVRYLNVIMFLHHSVSKNRFLKEVFAQPVVFSYVAFNIASNFKIPEFNQH